MHQITMFVFGVTLHGQRTVRQMKVAEWQRQVEAGQVTWLTNAAESGLGKELAPDLF